MASATNSEQQGTPQQVELTRVETFATMFRREYPSLVALAWTLTGSRAAAEDIAQDAMLELYRRWDEAGSIINLHSYLRRMCVNMAASSFRRRAAEARALLRLASQTTIVESLPEESETFWAEVRQLPRRQAQVIALFYACDMSVEQVGETLEMASGTVKAHLNQGRNSLSRRLAPSLGSTEGTNK